MRKYVPLSVFALVLSTAPACNGSGETADSGGVADSGPADSATAGDTGGPTDAGGTDTGTDAGPDAGQIGAWDPGLPPTAGISEVRGYKVARAIIHAHNIYSHDGCDSKPWIDPNDPEKNCEDWWEDPACVPDEQCVNDLRAALCTLNIDALFLTDHRGTLSHAGNFDELYVQREGDTWAEEGGIHTGSVQHCADGHAATLMVGSENDIMPIGLTSHPSDDPAKLSEAYGASDAAAVQNFKDHGAVVAVQHSEGHDVDYLRNTPVEAIEIYNFHVSMILAAAYLSEYLADPESQPGADLQFMRFYEPLSQQLTKWYSTVYFRDVSPFIGTDIHRNTIPKIMPDGERLDSYRRFMRWFSNHLLVRDFLPSEFKDAVRSGRLYVVAEALGTPTGFDFFAETAEGIKDPGGTVSAALSPTLAAKKPQVLGFPGAGSDATLVLKRIGDGAAEEVARSSADLSAPGLAPGAYYVEVLFTPNYLRPLFKSKRVADQYIKEFVWIYSSAIRIKE